MYDNKLIDNIKHLGKQWQEFKDTHNNNLTNTKNKIRELELAMSKNTTEFKEAKYNDENREYKSLFLDYIRSGNEAIKNYNYKALSSASSASGGYLIGQEMNKQINNINNQDSIIRKLSPVTTISYESLEVIIENTDFNYQWGILASSRAETNTPTILKKVITAHELFSQPKISQRLLDDSCFDLEQWLVDRVTNAFSKAENAAFINGNGTSQPIGILTDTNITRVNSGTSGAITSDSIIKLYYSLKDEYRRNAAFLMNKSTLQAIRTLKDPTSKQYLWQPNYSGPNYQETILGVPVYTVDDMPAIASASESIILADFAQGYRIVDKDGVSIMRDPYTDKPFVKFYITKRVGGAVIQKDAIKILKLAA